MFAFANVMMDRCDRRVLLWRHGHCEYTLPIRVGRVWYEAKSYGGKPIGSARWTQVHPLGVAIGLRMKPGSERHLHSWGVAKSGCKLWVSVRKDFTGDAMQVKDVFHPMLRYFKR